jgi:hypothetical protein
MRLRPMMTGAACLLMAGIGAAGCSSAASSSAAGSTPTSTTAGTSATGTGTGTAAATGTATSTSSAGSPQSSGQGSLVSAANCQPGSLRIVLGTVTGATGQRTQAVDMTNGGSSPCSMDGFPGTNLVGTVVGPDHYSKAGYTWPLTRAARPYSRVTLQPGATAHFDLVYLPATSGDIASGSEDLDVTTMLITPPDDFSHAQLSWAQGVLLQDAATRPGTYITPVVPGA